MHTVDIIRNTFDKIFTFYRNLEKEVFNVSVGYSIFWGFVAMFAALPILLVLGYFNVGNEYDIYNSWLNSDSLYHIRFKQYVSAVYIMTLPIFGIYLLNKKADEAYSFRAIFSYVNQQQWIIWILLTLGIFFIYTITFTFRFERQDYLDDLINTNYSIYNVGYWPDLILDLIKIYLPYFSAMLFAIIYFMSGKINISKQKNIFFAVLIMSFIIETLAAGMFDCYNTYITTFFHMIPFLDNLAPNILGLILQLGFTAYIFSAVAIGFTYPFKMESEQKPTIE